MNTQPRRQRSRRTGWIITVIIVAVVAILGVLGTVVAVRTYYNRGLEPVSNSQTAITVTIPSGSTVGQIATQLKEEGLIRNERVFAQYVRNQGVQDQLQAGTYSLRPSQSIPEIVAILTGGNIVENLFTILPGQTIDQIKSSMINAGFDAAEVEAAFDPALYEGHPALVDKPAGTSLEGYLYPESFQKTAETKPQTIIRQSLDEMQEQLTPELRAGLVAQGLTAHQALIIGSIIEKEVANQTDRAQVAQVFLKRYREGVPLGADPTALYGAIVEGQEPSVFYDSPYNTRIHQGLPPGPIGNVSRLSLQALAHPAPTDWLFFVAGDDGVTYFSRTLAEHEALTKEHCKKLCQSY